MAPEHRGASHEYDEHTRLGDMELRVRALKTVLTQKGYVDPAALEALVATKGAGNCRHRHGLPLMAGV